MGFGPNVPVGIAALDIGGQASTEVGAGRDAAALLTGVDASQVKVGQVLVSPRGAAHASTRYAAQLNLARDDENPERNTTETSPKAITVPLGPGVKGTFRLEHDGDPFVRGTAQAGTLTLDEAVLLEPGITMTLMWGGAIEGDLTVGAALD